MHLLQLMRWLKLLDPHKVLFPFSYPQKGSAGPTWMWRFEKPVINYEKCSKCGFCWMYCPEGVISFDENGYPRIDYEYCKGCGVCATECPTKAIEMISEYG